MNSTPVAVTMASKSDHEIYDYDDYYYYDQLADAGHGNLTGYDMNYYNSSGFQGYTFNDSLCDVDMEAYIDSMPGYEICYHILLPIVCAVGIVGSILTVIVLSRKTMSTSTNSYLISLAIADLGFLMIISPKCIESKLDREPRYYYLSIMTYGNVLLQMFLSASVWLTVMLAVERYIAICHPLRAMTICTVVRARIIILSIFAFSIIFHMPKFFRHKLVYFQDPCLNQSVPHTEVTSLGVNETYRLVTICADGIVLVLLSFSLLLYLNVCLILEIHRSTNYLRYHLASDSNAQTIITGEEIKITMMLISVVVNFFICASPYIILIVLRQFKRHMFDYLYLYMAVSLVLFAMRSSLNFILYCWFSEIFWNTFKRTFCMPQCILSRAPTWVRHRMWNHSDHGHSSNNNRKISYFNTKDTTC